MMKHVKIGIFRYAESKIISRSRTL